MYDNIIKKCLFHSFLYYLLLLTAPCHQVYALSHQEFVATYKDNPPSVREYWKAKVDKKVYTIEKDLAGYQEKEAWLKTLKKGTIEENDLSSEKVGAARVGAIVHKLRSWGYDPEEIPDFYIQEAIDHPIVSVQLLKQDTIYYYNIALVKKHCFSMPLYEQAVHAARAIEAQRAYQSLLIKFYGRYGSNSREILRWINSMQLQSTVNACIQIGGEGCEMLATYFQNINRNAINEDIQRVRVSTDEQKIAFLRTVSNDVAPYAYALLLKAVNMEGDVSKSEILTDAEIEDLRSKTTLFLTINFTQLVHDLNMDAAHTHIFNPDYKANGLPRWVPKMCEAKS